jgi:sugar phosphate isomerase/epimerase
MQTNRRQFLKLGFGYGMGAGMALTNPLAQGTETQTQAQAQTGNQIPIGFQLYTVRGEFERDVPGTLQKLGPLGYKGVEFWGYAGTPNVYQKYTATELRKLLDDHGLKCCGMHLELKAFAAENLKRTIENNLTLGSPYLNVAAAKEKMSSEAGIAELARLLNETAKQVQAQNLAVGYHAHPFDFEKINNRFAWDLLFSQTAPTVNMQMDVGNCLSGKGDPIAMLKKYPGRTRSIHIKEHQEKTFDSDFYKEVFHLCETTSGTKWYIVEMGGRDGNGFDVPRSALEKLHRLGKG